MASFAVSPRPESVPANETRSLLDADVVKEVVRGNREMFEVIVRRYNPQLYRVGMGYLRNHAQTEDAMQNAYVHAFLNLSRFEGRCRFGTWLTRIMINECLMLLRRTRRDREESLESAGNQRDYLRLVAPPVADPLHTHDLKAVLEAAIHTLPRTQRAVYLLREVQRLSTQETAQCLRLSPANVKVSLHRAREALKHELLRSAAGVELFSYPARFCDPLTTRVMAVVREAVPAPSGQPDA